jgi:hypothetical protein
MFYCREKENRFSEGFQALLTRSSDQIRVKVETLEWLVAVD